MLNRRNNIFPLVIILVGALAILATFWAVFRFGGQLSQNSEFAVGWTAAKRWLVADSSPYAPDFPAQVEHLTGQKPAPFILPFYATLFFVPLAGFPFSTAALLWLALSILAFVGLIFLALSISGWKLSPPEIALLIFLSLFWYNGARAILTSQLVIFSGLMILGALWLIQHKQDSVAGFLLAAATLKPDLALVLVVFIAVWGGANRRFQIVFGLLAGLGFLWAISFLLMPGWLLGWLQVLVGTSGRGDWYGSALSVIASVVPGVRKAASFVLHGITLVYLVVEWFRLRSDEERPFLWAALMTLTVTVLAGFRAESANAILLLPALCLICRMMSERWGRPGQLMAWVLLAAVVGLSWWIVLSRPGPEPVRLLFILPLVTWIGLFWIRWWAVRAARLPFEVLRDRIGN